MLIDRITSEDVGGRRRIAARVVWEGSRTGPDGLWFETDAPFAQDMEPAPEAFLVAATPIAAGLGEPRLAIEGRVCTRLRDGLAAAMHRLADWYPRCREIPIQATGGFAQKARREPARIAVFLSGGVDSLSLLFSNRREPSREGASRVQDAIHLFGWHSDDFEGPTPRPERVRMWREQQARLEGLAESLSCAVVPVRTNVRTFHPGFPWSRDVAFGAGMIAAAHAFPRRWSEVRFASGGFPGAYPPHGSHPDLDPLYSSSAVEVRHADAERTRMEKIRELATWPEALAVLEVCLHHEVAAPGIVNCGTCEKCVRTMLALSAIGRLDEAVTFPGRGDMAERLEAVRLPSGHLAKFSEELVHALSAAGRHDLARTLERKLAEAASRAVRRERRKGRWWHRWARARRARRASAAAERVRGPIP